VNSKIFIKFCERFEDFWFEFDMKRIDLKRLWKKRKKISRALPFGTSA
jgi:hypothetical protein